MNLGAEAVSLKNVIPYDVCAIERPCVNGGTCRAFNIRYGYVCECPSGLGGEKCEQRRETCSPGLCGPEGRCVNLPQGGYSCACPLRLTGDHCSRTIQIADPAFGRTSFISYDTIKGGLMTLSIKLDFNPRRLEDGIILYNAQKADGKQDFIALVVKDRHLEFRFDVGSGPAIIRSRYPLRANEWTKVVAERRGREGMLTVNDEESVNAQVAANDRQLYEVYGPHSDDQLHLLNQFLLLCFAIFSFKPYLTNTANKSCVYSSSRVDHLTRIYTSQVQRSLQVETH
uniref:EGF-like domain-containing protein n=1 Tax=Biomphalaria glabrata TaxID=6526 RepID=A0A2C9KC15_BIOGL